MRISLVSYTYNDSEFLIPLLANSRNWGIDFHETIIVDDFSTIPFQAPANSNVTILRNQHNLGPAQTKQIGLGAASGDIILSIDCDIRPHKKWALHALSYLQHQEIGAVGTYQIYLQHGLSKASQWQHNVNKFSKHPDELANFIMGGIFAIRRDVYQSIGGIRCNQCDIAEDIRMSKDITNKGFKLINIKQYPVYQARALDIYQLCKQNIIYGGESQVHLAYSRGIEHVIAKQLAIIVSSMHVALPKQPSLHIFALFIGVSLLFFVKDRLETLRMPTDILDNVLAVFIGLLSNNTEILNILIRIVIRLQLESALAALLDNSSALAKSLPAPLSGSVEEIILFYDALVRAATAADLEDAGPSAFHYLDDKPITHGIHFLK